MKRLAMVLAIVAMGACKKPEQQPAQGQMMSDTSHMMMSDTSKMMMVDTTMHVMKVDTSKKMMAPAAKAAPKKKP
jgi:hypothetical protein